MTKAAFTQADLSRAMKAMRDAGFVPEVILEAGRAHIRPMSSKAPAKPVLGDLQPKAWDEE